ncbi:RNA polymerase sigma factor RpoE [Luminiphilus sp.]|nr:RNA polymerase sigma factor RpoE [Luminiphilus sp.]MDA7839923.1 RNA polymerase sigma factor RpoE [Luminiphilus sp.]MDA8658660.1 RNA polymerase sigma factor RpoE [Luminiphilus sp.]MDA8827181.1 RNA polymerase sigma factor RpoE [Luminiphilus sp.]MDB2352018.1 RNA polymerase sigma factor RpoE [Luminiphilus sp.]
MTARETDQQLVVRAQRGDTRAFDLLVLKYQGRIATLVARFVNDATEVEDVTQEAFIKAFRALPKFRGESAFYTWLYRIASNAAKNYLVARGRRPATTTDVQDAEYFEEGDALREIETPENAYFGSELAKTVQGALEGLPDELRAALSLREFDGLSYEEIADVMACPVGTVRSRIFRAREVVDSRVRAQLSGE